MEFSPQGPQGPLWRSLDVIVGAIGIFWMLRWWFGPLPTQLVSAIFATTSIAAICVGSFADSDKVTGICWMSALAVAAVYIGAFHGARLFALYWLLALSTLTLHAISLSLQQGWAVAAAKSVEIGAVVLVMPTILHLVYPVFAHDAVSAERDQLTGLHNRRGFNGQSVRLAMTAHAQRSELSIIVVDIDRFKRINDHRGHDAGDRVIVLAALRIRVVTGDRAVVGRLGGDEFCVAMIAPVQSAIEAAEQIRIELESIDTVAMITASIGVATGRPLRTDRPRDLVSRLIIDADNAMYTAKRDGGNRVATLR
ncbi:GGDEF domain-containing protein [Mycobacteroides stephanolepidis]|nr:GGDEF domain-containing protein [[Mycobacterium] stephanolepidis]